MNENNANFTPAAPNFKTLVRMSFQGLTNFPYIEEDFDALTNYGLLSKVVEYLNQVISNNNEQNTLMTGLYNAYVSLQDYVNDYFDNLDVQEEINNKLDEMAQDGSLTNLIKGYVDPIYEAYEEEINSIVNNQNTEISNFKSDVNNQINVINTKVDSATSGSPLVASSTSGMTDTDRVYVNTTDGNWYYYDGDSWEIGGVYQSSSTDLDQKNLNLDMFNTNNKYSSNNLIKTAYVNASLSNATWDGYNLTIQAGGYAFFLVTVYPRTPNVDYYIYFNSNDLHADSGYNLKATTSATGTHYKFQNKDNFYYGKIYYSTLTNDTKYLQIRFDNRNGDSDMHVNNLIFSFNIYKDLTGIKNELNKIVHVDTTGNDTTGDGTYAHPYKTIAKGLENGDILYIHPGEYFENFDSFGSYIERDKIHLLNQFISNGAKVIINFSEKLGNTSSYNSIKRVSYSSTSDDDIYKVFVSQTETPIVDATWDYPRVALWGCYNDPINDKKLTPVLSLELCEATEDSFYYDGTYIYINNDATTYYLSSTKQNASGLRFRNVKDGLFTGIDFSFGYADCVRFDLCSNLEITNCSFNHSNSLDGVEFYNSHVNMNNSTAYKNNNDGIGIQQSGSSSFINCDSYYNSQDGLSHHDNCIGNVIGGNYHHNGKAGVSTPTYGAYVNLYSIYSHDNLFGYQIYANAGSSVKPIIFNNCIGLNNNQYDLQVSAYQVLDYNSKYTTTNVINDGNINVI